MPAQKRKRFTEEFGLPEADVENLINWKELAGYFEEVVSEIDEWIGQEIPRYANEGMDGPFPRK